MRFEASDAVTDELLALEPACADSSNAAAKKKKKKKKKKSVAKTTDSGDQEDRLGNEAATNDESEAGAGRVATAQRTRSVPPSRSQRRLTSSPCVQSVQSAPV